MRRRTHRLDPADTHVPHGIFFHPEIWILVPAATTALVTTVGIAFCYRTVVIPPLSILRESATQQ